MGGQTYDEDSKKAAEKVIIEAKPQAEILCLTCLKSKDEHPNKKFCPKLQEEAISE